MKTKWSVIVMLLTLFAMTVVPVQAAKTPEEILADKTRLREEYQVEKTTYKEELRLEKEESREEFVENKELVRDEKRVVLDEKKMAGKEAVEERRQSRRAERVMVHANRVEARFEVYTDRLEKLIVKLQARIDTSAKEGKDIAAAQAKLDEASDAYQDSQVVAADVVEQLKVLGQDTNMSVEDLRAKAAELIKSAHDSFKGVTALIKESIVLLKQLYQD